jgi:tetratricopeptide (TPR) repeat protein
MHVTMMLLTVSLLLFQAASAPIPLPELLPPSRESVPDSPAVVASLRAGDALYAQGNFEDAVARYEEALAGNPSSAYALNQLADAYLQKKEYRKAVETAVKGIEYKSNYLPLLYTTLGNALDTAGQPQDAVAVFKKGLVLAPTVGTLYYNLGVTYQESLKDPVQARAIFKQGAVAAPNHPGIHFQLAGSFFKDDFKTPALLALSRYLVLDAAADRAAPRYNLWRQLLNGNARPPDQNGQIQIFVNPNQKKDEGNLQTLDMDISMSKVVAFKTSEGKTQMQSLFQQVDSLFAMYAKRPPDEDKDKFLWTYYMPYFIEMQQKSFVEPFVYYVSQRTSIPGVREWLDANRDRVNAFLDWSKNYSWPKP